MTPDDCTLLMEHHGVKPTANRINVLRTLAEAGRPLTLGELEMRLLSIDKSGIFRALTLFREHHLLHTIDDGGGNGVRYELCHSHHDDSDDDLHPHFHCERCHRTFCLEQSPVPAIALPEGFLPFSANYIVKGLCPHCALLK